MAKTRQLTSDMANASAETCIRRLVAFRLKEICSYKENVYTGSVDAVHDMRVACRRLQSLCKVFHPFFHRKRAKQFRRTLRRLLRGLGAVREYDVLIGYIVEIVKPATHEQEVALGLLIGRYSLCRSRAHRSLLAVVRELDAEKGASLSAGRIPRLVSSDHRAVAFRVLLKETIGRLFSRFIEAGVSVADHPRRVDALHRFRIQGKPLRYIMELSTPFFGTLFLSCYHEVKSAIELLGDIHDTDIALNHIKTYREEIRLCNYAAKRAPSRFSGIGSSFLLKAMRALRVRRDERFFAMSVMFGRWRTSRFQAKLLASMK